MHRVVMYDTTFTAGHAQEETISVKKLKPAVVQCIALREVRV